MNPHKVARVARYDEALKTWKTLHMTTEMVSKKALGPGTFEGSGRDEDWRRWEESMNNEMDAYLELREAWLELTSEDPRQS